MRYSSADTLKKRLARIGEDYAARLQTIENEEFIPFNRMSDWGDDGRIKASALEYRKAASTP